MPDSLKPLHIGPIVVDFPVVLAPLAGYTDLSYRLICRGLSAPYCATEAMLDTHLLHEGKLRQRLARVDEADHPLAGQLMGREPAVMAAAAAVLRDAGFDVIDLNFACPVKKVLARERGGFLMSRPDLALGIVRAVRDAVPDRPVTIKLRRSFREVGSGEEDFWEIASGAFEAGVAAACVHARSVEQKYQGRADWGFLSRVKRAFPDRTIIGSGDVLAAGDALRMIRETGVDGASAARGAIGNPWFIRQARDIAAGREPFQPTLADQRELISRHFDLTRKIYGPGLGVKKMRNFAIHYAHLHPHPVEARKAAAAVTSEKAWWDFLDSYYPGSSPSAPLRPDGHPVPIAK